MSTSAAPAAVAQKRNARTAATSGFFGTALEYYDFFLYATAASLFFGRLFFPHPAQGTLLALSSLGVAYVARPFGAVLWGHLGDRFGRKKIMIAILLTMGIATFLVGCIPSYATIGPAAPVILVLLRVLQGLSAGGEQAGSALLAFEHAPEGKRAFYTSWTHSGTQFGNFLASVVFLPLTAFLPDDAMLAWGWRIPFWLSALVIAFTFVLRRRLAEPETYQELKQEGPVTKVPLVEVLRGHWRAVLRVAVAGLCLAPTPLVYVFGLSYATTGIGLSRSPMLGLIAGASLTLIATQPLFAMLSDRMGRKPVFVTGAVGCAALTPVWLHAVHTGNWTLIYLAGFAIMGVFFAMQSGVVLATFLEMFPTHIRFTGMAVSFMLGVVGTGFLPAIAQSFVQNDPNNWPPVAWLFVAIILAAGVAVLTGPENHRVPTGELGLTRARRTVPTTGDAATPEVSGLNSAP
ncbi:MFS transporter [Streptomyces sp. NL15-2K]|uniref:MFS transporter n=1 Tax=Streptomyces sp. NL15-2K TaxID=376149 RepID=UPI000F56D140|nr:MULTISPECIES: MFS transporter [Actinomycetes]WKX13302.1 MFS transporter [Kutzneria buriramensis]